MKVTYVEYMLVGSFFSESSISKVDSRDINLAKSNMPKNSFGFRFYDREEIFNNGKTLKGDTENYSAWYYLGEKLSLSEVKSKYSDKRILISNMEGNDWKHVVMNKFGQFIPLDKKDVVIS